MSGSRKVMALVLAAIMVLMVLGACSGSGTAGDAAGNGTEVTEDEAEKSGSEDKTKDKTAEAAEASSGETAEKDGKRVYFAAPMFCQSEKEYNAKIVKILEDHGYTVFLPQRDGLEAFMLEGKSEEEKTKMIFKLDHDEVNKADIVFMNLDGRVPDEGACVELGMAYEAGKRCYGFKTDPRSVELDMDLNPMIAGCMIKIFENYDGDKMVEELEKYLDENEL